MRSPTQSIDLRVLGQVTVRAGPLMLESLLEQRKRLALLVFLVLGAEGRHHERDAVTAMFWPLLDEAHAHQALRKALHFLRRHLGDGVILPDGRHRIGIADGAIWCDATDFLAAVRGAQREEALERYHGELMAGFHVPSAPDFDRWLEEERARLSHIAYDAAMSLGRKHAAAGDPERALRCVRHAERAWPTSEEAAELRVSILHGLGEDVAALQEYQAFAARIAREFDLTPGSRLTSLVEDVRASRGRRRSSA